MIKFSDTEKAIPLWENFAKKTSPELAEAMKDYYSIYDAELVSWYAELYDPKIGGFYYSPSARDNEKCVWKDKEYILLPDAESTCQALGFIGSSGIAKAVGNDYVKFLPEWMKKQIADFIYGLQDPDGFFYHPQWGKNIAVSRRARDFNWSRSMLERLGRPMRYPTMLDNEKKEDKDSGFIPEHLQSKEAFVKYLDTFDLATGAYSAGNTLSSQFAQIKSQGLDDILIDFLNAHQHADSGHWNGTTNYFAINGLMKISGIYNAKGIVLPHSYEAAMSAVNAIASPETVNATVDLWNIWVAITNICSGLLTFGGEEGKATVDSIRRELWQIAVPAVKATKEKIYPFKRSDHGYSYCKGYPSPISQGAPVCVPYLDEGDINGCVIATVYMVGMVYNALGISGEDRVPLYGADEAKMFLDILERNNKKVNG